MAVRRILFALLIVIEVASGYYTCPNDYIPCRNATDCVPLMEICVKYRDCDDRTGHPLQCNFCSNGDKNRFHCLTDIAGHLAFSCLSKLDRCNGHVDCIDGQDEQQCGTEACRSDQWRCANGTCIPKSFLCDNIKHCSDGSDENVSQCSPAACPSNFKRCPDGKCIPQSKKCEENTNELNVARSTKSMPKIMDSCSIPTNVFPCSKSKFSSRPICISKDRICDEYVDCPDGDDEQGCTDECDSDRCAENFKCINHPDFQKLCRCVQTGYHPLTNTSVSLNQSCQDYNECQDSSRAHCSFQCTNTNGGYTCSCPDGIPFDEMTQSCGSTDFDLSQPNLIVLFDSSIHFLHVSNITHHHYQSSAFFNSIKLQNDHHINQIQYDPYQHFILYYDSSHATLFCHHQLTSQSVALIVDRKIEHFTYDAERRNLFFIESVPHRLHIYHPITCDPSSLMRAHSRSLDWLPSPIDAIKIDSDQGRLIFSSDNRLFTAKIFEQGPTSLVYTSDRPIVKFSYDKTFQRLFWTTSNTTDDELFPLYTCDGQFQQCHDTFVRLPLAWPFAFSNDGLIYPSSSLQWLKRVQLYGRHRFALRHVTKRDENIRLLEPIHHRFNKENDPCFEKNQEHCPNEICVRLNSNRSMCLTVSTIVQPPHTFDVERLDPMLPDQSAISPSIGKRRKLRVGKVLLYLFQFLLLGLVLLILIRIGQRIRQRRRQQAFDRAFQAPEQRLTIDEPILDEFNVVSDDRTGDRLPLTNQLNY